MAPEQSPEKKKSRSRNLRLRQPFCHSFIGMTLFFTLFSIIVKILFFRINFRLPIMLGSLKMTIKIRILLSPGNF